MTLEEQFNRIAKEYDENRRKFIPCFNEFYNVSTRFVTANIPYPERILDLGSGTGLLAYFWYRHFPEAEFVLADIAGDMLHMAQKRFSGIENVHYIVLDYAKEFPKGNFDCIISALSVHHLSPEEKKMLFLRIYEKLPDGGIFVNYDQFSGGSQLWDSWFDTCWEKQLEKSGLTEKDIALWRERRKLDKECSVEEEVRTLQTCGFQEVKCIYSHQKFAVIAAIKRGKCLWKYGV